MLDVDTKKQYNLRRYIPILSLISAVFIVQIYIIAQKSLTSEEVYYFMSHFKINPQISNTKNIGDVLYTDFFFQFQLSGLILFVAMVGAIVLTLKEGDNFNKVQNISKQVFRKKKDSVKIVEVKTGQGLDI
jgi:NADH-quinone oxidoreductase subunit J